MPRLVAVLLFVVLSLLSSFVCHSTFAPGRSRHRCRLLLFPRQTRFDNHLLLSMVEGHSTHRVAHFHRQRLVGKTFQAWSPNGRFTEGAALIDNKVFTRIEAVGKNLFAFFQEEHKVVKTDHDDSHAESVVVMHVHFGMAGNWAVYDRQSDKDIPEPSKTNRLRLQNDQYVADLSAMTVQHGNMQLYHDKRNKLGEDPLRSDANPQNLWTKVHRSNKSIGALIMDQSFFTGPGNIYRCEILFKAGVHPNIAGKELTKPQFDAIWSHTVDLLQRGFASGSILTVDPEEARALGKPQMRRYIYNTSHCPRCGSNIQSWDINSRTCYACLQCQPKENGDLNASKTAHSKDVVPFHSHCARESLETRLKETGADRLTVKELQEVLSNLGVPWSRNAKKTVLVQLWRDHDKTEKVLAAAATPVKEMSPSPTATNELEHPRTTKELQAALVAMGVSWPSRAKKAVLAQLWQEHQTESCKDTDTPDKFRASLSPTNVTLVTPEAAAAEKARAGESLAVEHIAELAPGQARRARKKLSFEPTLAVVPEPSNASSLTKKRSRRRRQSHDPRPPPTKVPRSTS